MQEKLPAARLQLIEFCLASLCYHRKTLDSTMHQKNQLRSSPFLTHMPPELIKLVEVRLPWESVTGITPNVTGQPTHVSLMSRITALEKRMESTEENIIKAFQEDLDRRHIGSQPYLEGNRIIQVMEQNFASLLAATQNLTPSEQALLSGGGGAGVSAASTSNEQPFVEVQGGRNVPYRFRFFIHSDGSYSRLPEGYVMPDMGLQQLITAWHCGDASKKIVPFKLLKSHELKSKTKSQHSDMRKLMQLVEEAAQKEGFQVNRRMQDWTVPLTVNLYESVAKYFNYDKSDTGKGRQQQLAYKTLLNHWYKHDKKFANAVA